MSNVNNAIQFLNTLEINISAHILPYVVVTTPIATSTGAHTTAHTNVSVFYCKY